MLALPRLPRAEAEAEAAAPRTRPEEEAEQRSTRPAGVEAEQRSTRPEEEGGEQRSTRPAEVEAEQRQTLVLARLKASEEAPEPEARRRGETEMEAQEAQEAPGGRRTAQAEAQPCPPSSSCCELKPQEAGAEAPTFRSAWDARRASSRAPRRYPDRYRPSHRTCRQTPTICGTRRDPGAPKAPTAVDAEALKRERRSQRLRRRATPRRFVGGEYPRSRQFARTSAQRARRETADTPGATDRSRRRTVQPPREPS